MDKKGSFTLRHTYICAEGRNRGLDVIRGEIVKQITLTSFHCQWNIFEINNKDIQIISLLCQRL